MTHYRYTPSANDAIANVVSQRPGFKSVMIGLMLTIFVSALCFHVLISSATLQMAGGKTSLATWRGYSNLTEVRLSDFTLPAHQPKCVLDDSPTDHQSEIDYRIVCTWRLDGISPSRLVFGVIDAKCLNRRDMLKLAKALKKRYLKYSTVQASFWDNEKDANYYAKSTLDNFAGLKTNLRVTYILDQNKHKEFIEFTPNNGKSRKRISLQGKNGSNN